MLAAVRYAWLALFLTGCVSRLIVEGDTDGGHSASHSDSADSDSEGDEETGTEEGSEDDGGPGGTDLPPPVERNTIYVNTNDALYTFVPETVTLSRVGAFSIEGGGVPSVTDIAIDRFGTLYAVSQGTLYVCDPQTVVCASVGSTSANSAGFAEFGALDATQDVLVLVEGSDVVHVYVEEDDTPSVVVGTLEGYSSSGDVMPLSGPLMMLSSPSPSGGDVLVAFDAANAAVIGPIVDLPPLSYGLAGFDGEVWVFTDLGQVFHIDEGGTPVELARADVRFWGAATHPASR